MGYNLVILENKFYVFIFGNSSSAGVAPLPAALCPQPPSILNENCIAAAQQQNGMLSK